MGQVFLTFIVGAAIGTLPIALLTWLWIRFFGFNLIPHLVCQIGFLLFSFYGVSHLGNHPHAVDLRIVLIGGAWLGTPIYYLGILPLIYREMPRHFHLFRLILGSFYCLMILGMVLIS